MKSAKRLLCALLSLAMALSLAACGGSSSGSASKSGQTSSPGTSCSGQAAASSGASSDQSSSSAGTSSSTPSGGEAIPGTEGMTAEEIAAWQKEPMYGKTLHYMMGDSCTAATDIADALGYYADEGLTVEGFKATSDIEGLGTNEVQIVVGHIAKQLVPATNGVDIVFVGGAHTGCKSLYVLGSSDYKTTQDLIGTSISTPNGIGASDYNITARLLDADGIDPVNDVNLTPVETGACVAAMENGEISAALLSDTFAYHMVEDGTLRMVRSMLDEDLQHICCAITMNGTFARENPITAAKMASAVKKALKWMGENPEEATKKLVELGLNNDDYEMNLAVNKSLQFGSSDEYAETQLRQIAADYLRLGLCTTTDDVDTIMAKYWMPLGSAD